MKQPAVSLSQRVVPRGETPLDCVRNYGDDEWEIFVGEWAEGLKSVYGYKFVECVGGAGDRGVDVRAYLGEPNDPAVQWDSFQCKHYQGPLQPCNIWKELGKLCYHTWQTTITIPRQYRFVAPMGVSPSLAKLLKDPGKLISGLKDNWTTYCLKGITNQNVPLEGDLLKYVDGFDLRILGYIPTNQLLAEHSKTAFWYGRFNIALPDRPDSPVPPLIPIPEEQRYVAQLVEAYSDSEGHEIDSSKVTEHPKYGLHFNRSRIAFYEAEGLNRFTRDYLPGAFEKFKNHILTGVEDIHAAAFYTALDRLYATTEAARTTQIPQNQLNSVATPGDRKGACHHLANENKLIWKR